MTRNMPLFLALGLFLPAPAGAETEPVYALVNARIAPVSGPVLEAATVVLRKGLIDAVGNGVAAPADARIIDASGLTLTPGLIDGFGGVGLGKPRSKARDLAPQAHALDRIEAQAVPKIREAGVTTALVIPAEGVLPGLSVLLNLSGDETEDMVLLEPAALHLQMTTREEGYPDSLMGTVALARQSLADAVRYRDAWAAYLGAPLARTRPHYDSGLESWKQVLAGRLPLIVTAKRENDVRRALSIGDEFHVRIVLAGAPQASRLSDLIKTRRLPLLVGVDFDPLRELSAGSGDEELDRQEIDEAERNPGALARAGVPFGFGSGHAKNYLAGIRTAIERGLPREAALRAATLGAAEALGVADRLGSLEIGKIANLVAWQGEPLAKDARPKFVFVDGRLYEPAGEDATEKKPASRASTDALPPVSPWAPPVPPGVPRGPVAIVNGTVLTIGPLGTLEKGTVVFENGKITAVGRDIAVPPGARVIDAAGRFVMPGLIDAHSHTAVEDSVNECSDSVTAEVRIADVLDPYDPDLYRQLAGGVTTLNVLHGSCNTIGGQNAVIKIRYGTAPEKLLFEGAPRGIKFALGENVKRSNSTQRGAARFPGTRMGVEATLRDAFLEARAYQREWADYEKTVKARKPGDRAPLAPRRDLRKETLVAVLEGRILVHAHCYRADEILMLMRVADEFGFKIRTFQHVLEGYKVASEIAKHGAGASTFIDWWGYKLEAYDATPYNPAILAAHGVNVSLNSDSSELARRLYWDAAKAVKYGGVSEAEALKMVTLNPAWQLGIDKRVGSLEAGKDADIAIFNAYPLAAQARVEMTLVDGTVYFDRSTATLTAAVAAGGGK
jgi:imidazolonepropionase-like amidohydrolase